LLINHRSVNGPAGPGDSTSSAPTRGMPAAVLGETPEKSETLHLRLLVRALAFHSCPFPWFR
jgi:hypothetical protein